MILETKIIPWETIPIGKCVYWISDSCLHTKLISDCRKHVLDYRTRLYPPTQNETFLSRAVDLHLRAYYLLRELIKLMRGYTAIIVNNSRRLENSNDVRAYWSGVPIPCHSPRRSTDLNFIFKYCTRYLQPMHPMYNFNIRATRVSWEIENAGEKYGPHG